jgi:ADP-ribose pyrophosphatase YjhB (NUDIX family)
MHPAHIIEVTGARARRRSQAPAGCERRGRVLVSAGRALEPGETLLQCAAREVAEETGLRVEATDLLHVAEFVAVAQERHKVECYFLATVREGNCARTGSIPAARSASGGS